MKRSVINNLLRDAKGFMAGHGFHLPPFASWGPADWPRAAAERAGLVSAGMGWDITDFGSGEFERQGLLLFTLRNGLAHGPPGGKPYAEKIMIVREGQVTPAHTHRQKMEDIINRGGGDFVIQLWNGTPERQLLDTPVTVEVDGQQRRLPGGGTLTLAPGESITLPPGLYHEFWAAPGRGRVLVGEVSRVNDDHGDNFFVAPVGRFPAIEEDEPPLHLLVSDYATWFPA